MAIIHCPECGREVSDRAKHCPHCGVTIARSATFYTSVVVGCVIALIGIFGGLYIAKNGGQPSAEGALAADSTATVANDAPATAPAAPVNSEEADWQTAQAANDLDAYLDYLAHHPDGPHANEARDLIEELARHITTEQPAEPADSTDQQQQQEEELPTPEAEQPDTL